MNAAPNWNQPMPGPGQDGAWRRHPDERWIVGDPGRQAEMVAYPADLAPDRPDTRIDGARLGDLEYRAVSLRGQGHWEERKPRQDAYLLRITANKQWLVGCVADGVSGSPYSHEAADIACREITRHLVEALNDQPAVGSLDDWQKLAPALPWQQAVDQACAAMFARANSGRPAAEQEAPLDEHKVRATLATTAVGFAVCASATDDGRLPCAVLVAAGDSSALVLSRGQWYPLTPVKNVGVEVASNAVRALPRMVTVTPDVGFLEPGDALVVVSDGIGDPLGTGTGEVGQFLAAHWSRPPDLLAFAGHAAFYRRGFTDDRTAAAVWHRSRLERPAEPRADPAAAAADDRAAKAHADTGEVHQAGMDPIDFAQQWTGGEGPAH